MKTYFLKNEEYLSFEDLPQNLYASLAITAKRFPDKVALSDPCGEVTYEQFLDRVDRLASALYSFYHVSKGDVCALLSVNSIDFCVAYYAIEKIGAVTMPLSTKLKAHELEFPLINSGAKLLILDENWLVNVEPILSETGLKALIFTGEGEDKPEGSRLRNLPCTEAMISEPGYEDGAILIYTSGTTGKPKGALLTHFNLLHGIECYKNILKVTEKDVTALSVPIFHITGLAAVLGLFVRVGGTIHLLPTFNARKTLEIIVEKGVTFLHASPTIFILLLENQNDFPVLPELKTIACGGANLPIEVIRKLHVWVPEIKVHTVYGLTETSSPATVFPDDPLDVGKLGSSGIPIPGLELRIKASESNVVNEPGKPGEIELRGSNVITEYFKPENGANIVFQDGWFATGDIGLVDAEGYVYVLDRKKDMINHGGEKVFCLEVENRIIEFPGVDECAVIGVPDPIFGEAVKAIIRLKKGCLCSEEELKQFLVKSLAKYKLPTSFVFVNEIPRTESGKINKRLLKEMYPF